MRWQGGWPRLLTGNPHSVAAEFETTLCRSAPLLPIADGVLFGAARLDGRPSRHVLARGDGTLVPVPTGEAPDAHWLVHGGGVADPFRGRVLSCEFANLLGCGLEVLEPSVFGTVRSVAADGRSMLVQTFERSVYWLALSTDGRALWLGLDDGAVHELDPGPLEPRSRWRLPSPLLWLLPLDAERAIGGDGAVMRFFALPRQREPGPQRELEPLGELRGLPGHGPVQLAALAPDRRHVALAAGGDVRIVVLE